MTKFKICIKILLIIVILILTNLSLLPKSSAQSNPQGKLSPKSYPWVGELYAEDVTNGYGCTAILIEKDIVLSAAHCVNGRKNIFIIFNGSISEGGIVSEVDFYKIHSQYNPKKFLNDIAILHLRSPINFYHTKLPPVDDSKYLKNLMFSLGYGVNENGEYTGNLNYSYQYLVGNIKSDDKIISTQFYDKITKKYSTLCHGDSGGPLVASGTESVLLGIASYSDLGCKSTSGSVRVSKYLSWISISETEFQEKMFNKSQFEKTVPLIKNLNTFNDDKKIIVEVNINIQYYILKCYSSNKTIYNIVSNYNEFNIAKLPIGYSYSCSLSEQNLNKENSSRSESFTIKN